MSADAKKHECPYADRTGDQDWLSCCGEQGELCDLCREDRSDARMEKIVDALAALRLMLDHSGCEDEV